MSQSHAVKFAPGDPPHQIAERVLNAVIIPDDMFGDQTFRDVAGKAEEEDAPGLRAARGLPPRPPGYTPPPTPGQNLVSALEAIGQRAERLTPTQTAALSRFPSIIDGLSEQWGGLANQFRTMDLAPTGEHGEDSMDHPEMRELSLDDPTRKHFGDIEHRLIELKPALKEICRQRKVPVISAQLGGGGGGNPLNN